jgi:putative aldouronate transport system substrate-binding protein
MDALNTLEYLEKNDKIIVAPGTSFISPVESTEIITLRNQCKRIIVDYSWKLIFAESEDSFYALQKELQATVLALGYEQVLEKDMENALKQNEERLAAIAASESVN